MLRYAKVAGQKQLPFTNGRGLCPACSGLLIAKCGSIKTHHWAHQSKDDCDKWSEPIGPWHLWWQNLVRPEFVEVVRVPHRADIVGNNGVVVELQHSPISAEDIAAREAHYGDMIWLFDATQRFAYMTSGERAFFSLGQTKHLELCRKPVFLDFGFDIVEVERFTDDITKVSGFGLIRRREWFAKAFLSDVRQPDSKSDTPFAPEGCASDPWSTKSPVWKLKHDTKWIDPNNSQLVIYRKWTEYIKMNYGTYKVGDSQNKRWDYEKLIDGYPDIANGWTKDEFRQMMDFFCATPIILGGLLRLLPLSADAIQVRTTVSATENLLRLAETHIQAGRLPVLKGSTKDGLLEKSRQHEIGEYGHLLRPRAQPGTRHDSSQRSLFEH